MSQLKIFTNPEFGEIRVVEINGEPWFVGKDVAQALGYTNHRKALADHVDAEDKRQEDGVTIRDSIGREQHPTISRPSKRPIRPERWAEYIPLIEKRGIVCPV